MTEPLIPTVTSAPLPARPASGPPQPTSPSLESFAGLDERSLRAAATEFEAVFLAQMLEAAGLGRTPESFGGGAGEDAFASLLVREQADLMARRGGIGLADRIVQSLLQEPRP